MITPCLLSIACRLQGAWAGEHFVRTKGLVVILLLFTLGRTVAASIYVPNDLQPGDAYHLLFVTEGVRTSSSPLISDYNAFVQGEAERTGALTESYGIDWFAIASTSTIDARDNAIVSGPVYLLDGTRIADNASDLWDGSIAAPIRLDQFGQDAVVQVWTGSETNGTAPPYWPIAAGAWVWAGASNLSNAGWIQDRLNINSIGRSFYALSEALSVPQIAVPEPAPLVLLSCLTSMFVGHQLLCKARGGRLCGS